MTELTQAHAKCQAVLSANQVLILTSPSSHYLQFYAGDIYEADIPIIKI